MIIYLEIYRLYGFNYEGYLKFRIGDEKYYCREVNEFIRALILNNRIRYECIIESLKGVDFRVFARYDKNDGGYVFEIELIDSYLNPNRVISFLESESEE